MSYVLMLFHRTGSHIYMGGHRHGKRGHFWKYCKVFLCISSYSKTLSRRIIYALFYNLSSASGGKGAQTSNGALSLNPLGYFCTQTRKFRNLPIPGKNPADADAHILLLKGHWKNGTTGIPRRIMSGLGT